VELEPFKVEYPSESFLAPSFELESISGGKVSLLDYRGKIVFINFWATWCSTCEVEMPSMEKLYQKYKLTFPVLLDTKSSVAKKDYKTTGVPETFIVNKNGIIVFKKIGPDDWSTDEMMDAFAQLVLGT